MPHRSLGVAVLALCVIGFCGGVANARVLPLPRIHSVLRVTRFDHHPELLLKSIRIDGIGGMHLRVSCQRCRRYRGRIRVSLPTRGAKLFRNVNWILQPGRLVSIKVYRRHAIGRYVMLGAELRKKPRLVFRRSGCLASLHRLRRCPRGTTNPRPGTTVPETGAGNSTNSGVGSTSTPPPPSTATLVVTVGGSGTGSVTGSGIDCPGGCSHSYAQGTDVTLTATPGTDSTFAGWSGACSGNGTCTVTLATASVVTATFNLAPHTLTVTRAGSGSGSVTASGFSCPGTCSASYPAGTQVTLTASAASESTFAGWGGACSGTGSCTVTMASDQNVTASFTAYQTLSVSVGGSGSGSVTGSGISCPGTCSHKYPVGTVVSLSAHPGSHVAFSAWSGACGGTGGCSVTMSNSRSVGASFRALPWISIGVGASYGCTGCHEVAVSVHSFPTGTFSYACYDHAGSPSSGAAYYRGTMTVSSANQSSWSGVFCYDSSPYYDYIVLDGVTSSWTGPF